VVTTIENGAFCFHECLLAGLALVPLRPFGGAAKLADVAMIDPAVTWTVFVPTE
jgi:hypothetical protein